jgi:hypothetical protein
MVSCGVFSLHRIVRLVLTGMTICALSVIATSLPASAATPNPPTGVTVSYSGSTAVVTWTAPTPVTGVTITGYTVTSSPGGLTCTVAAPGVTCMVPGLMAATSYTFGVVASSAGGSGSSASSAASTSPTLAATSTSLSATPLSPQNLSTPITFTATTPAATTGTVNFKVGGTTIAGCGTQAVSSGVATCTTNALVAGSNSVTAVYSGDSNFAGSTSSALSYSMSSTTLTAASSPLVITTVVSPFNTALTLATTGGNGSGAITYSATNGTATGCSVSGATLTVPANVSGTCLVTATQASAGTYLGDISNVTTVNFFWNYAGTYAVITSTPVYSCPYSEPVVGATCQVFNVANASPNTTYSCSSGWSGPTTGPGGPNQCWRIASVSQATCTNNGGTWLGGNQCRLWTSANATTTYSCPAGETLVSALCEWYTYPAATLTGYTYTYGYTCPSGGSVGTTICTIIGGSGPNLRSALLRTNASVAAPTTKSPNGSTSVTSPIIRNVQRLRSGGHS